MSDLFDVDGASLDLGFENLRGAQFPVEQQLRAMLQEMWERYEPYADPDFRHGFARDVDGRFWEMYLGCALLEAGHALLPVVERQRQGGQPDLCVLEDGRRIWIEAITPDEGAPGPDQIVRPVPINEGGGFIAAPIRQAQLRTSGAFWTKAQKIKQGVITQQDTRIIAISAGRFGAYVSEQPLPLIMTTLFPIGDAYVTIDRETGDVLSEGFQAAPFTRRNRHPIPRTAFLDERFADISGVIWSRISIGNLSRQVRPIIYVHNPLAQAPLPTNWGVWDRVGEPATRRIMRLTMAVPDEQRLITPISQRQFEIHALSLDRGPNFNPAQIFGAYQAGRGSATGCILVDPEKGRSPAWRCVGASTTAGSRLMRAAPGPPPRPRLIILASVCGAAICPNRCRQAPDGGRSC